jgi:hypothetical protein
MAIVNFMVNITDNFIGMEIIKMDITSLILALMAILAVFISIISLYFTLKFSKQQLKFSKQQIEHNKNSVKPWCSILQTNYVDFISVRLRNDGMGPLKITKFECRGGSVPANCNTLFDIFPKIIDQKKYFIVYKVIGRTISANDQLWLLRINPENAKIKCKVRNELKKIEIYVEYIDIYNNTFNVSQPLDYFKRDDIDLSRDEIPPDWR